MPTTWVLHAVGGADLGVPAHSPGDVVRQRTAELARMPDDAVVARLSTWDWPEPVCGRRSPLAAALSVVPPAASDVRLALVCTARTASIGTTLVDILRRVPRAFGPAVTAILVTTEEQDGDGGIAEQSVVRSLAPVLAERGPGPAAAWVVWGSGSTQLALGLLESATVAALPWKLLGVCETGEVAQHEGFDPLAVSPDPIVPLLRRWHFHQSVAELAERSGLRLSPQQHAVLREDAARWQRAYVEPTAPGLRLHLAAALARAETGDWFLARRYALARYHELRAADPHAPVDLEAWAGGGLGEVIRAVRSAGKARDPAVAASLRSPSGRWLASACVHTLNEIGKRCMHELRPPTPAMVRRIRAHLAEFSTHRDTAGLPPADAVAGTAAWYIRVAGTYQRDDPFAAILADGPDEPVRTYLGLPAGSADPADLRFCVLGTAGGSAAVADIAAAELNTQAGAPLAASATIPPIDDPQWTVSAARALLGEEFARLAGDVGAIVVVPTGRKGVLLPLIIAAHHLAAEHGLPLFLRQNNTPDLMHRMPLRFGADRDLMEAAATAVSTADLRVAARLLDACAETRDLADTAHQLANALHARRGPLPEGFSAREPERVVDRLHVWAWVAARATTQHSRAVIAASAVLDAATDLPRMTDAGVPGMVRRLRNSLPLSHGDTGTATDLARALPAGERLGEQPVPALLELLASTVARRSGVRTTGRRTLLDLLLALATEIQRRRQAENERLARQQVLTGLALLDPPTE